MNKALRQGKGSELMVAAELTRQGLDVYLPCVDDQAIDMIVRLERPDGIHCYDIQVKSVAGYNRIIGVQDPTRRTGNYVLVIHYRHATKPDEFFYLTADQIVRHQIADSGWGDLVFNRAEREQYAPQTLSDLPRALREGDIAPVPGPYQIRHAAAKYTMWKLGDAIRVMHPRWEHGEWVVGLFPPDGEDCIGHLYFDRRGVLLVSKSATYQSLRESIDAGHPAASAA